MTGFGTKISSIVEAEGKTPSSNFKRVVIDEARKQAEQAKTSHNLSTSENTSGSDTARLEADKTRRQTEAAKASSDVIDPEKTLNQDTAHIKADKGKGRAEESSETAPSGSFKIFTDKSEEFAENAHKNEDQDDESDRMKITQSEASKPNDLRQQIYEKATPHLGKLMNNSKDAEATSELNKLNKQIKEQNLKDKLSKKDLENFLIQVLTFAANFEMAKDYCESLQKDSADDIARQKLININNILSQLNERHEYLRTWLITLPPRPGTNEAGSEATESFEAAESFRTAELKAVDQAGQAFTKGDVKIKVSVEISDEFDGLTLLEKVVIVRKAEFESRIIVNRETDVNSYYEIHSETNFEKEVVKE